MPIFALTLAAQLVFQMVSGHDPGVQPKATSADLARGEQLFQAQCSYCHGPRGEGARGANLARPKLPHAPDDVALFRVINGGIAGTGMPGNAMSVREIWQVSAYVRSLGKVKRESLPGDARRGAGLYTSKGCAGCHTVSGQGGSLGPDLSDIGARSGAAYLRRALLEPEADIAGGFLQLRVLGMDGRALTGARVNEDSFSVQLSTADGNLHSFWKSELKEIHKDTGKSPMPRYRDSLTQAETDDLVAFLVSLEGAP